MAIAQQPLDDFRGDNLSVRQFGVVMDGSTDDTANFQLAMNACASLGAALMIPGDTPLLCSRVRLPSGLILIGRPGATVLQKDGSASSGTPFVANQTQTGGGNSDILLQGLTFDANAGNQTAVNVDTMHIRNMTNITLRGCGFQNSVRGHVFGELITGISIEDSQFSNWGTGNIGAIYLASRNGNNFGGTGGPITGIRIRGGTVDGRVSHSSCIKIDADLANPSSQIIISDLFVYPGDAPADDTLGIELFSGVNSHGGFNHFEVANCVVIGENNTNTRIFGISLGGSGGKYGSVHGCSLADCRAFGIETIASHVKVMDNDSVGCGPWTVDAGAASLEDVDISHNQVVEPTFQFGFFNCIHAIAHFTAGTGPYSITDLRISENFCSSSAIPSNNLVIVENQTGGIIKSVQILDNEIVGAGFGSGSGLSVGPNVGPYDLMTVRGNVFRDLAIGINPGGTNGRYLFNRFSNVGAPIGAPFHPTDSSLEILESNGVFVAQTLQISGMPRLTLQPTGDITIPNETATIQTGNALPSSPNKIYINDVNFGSDKQGGVISVNSRWDGFPNWVKNPDSLSNSAMFVVFGANRFAVRFGLAGNSDGSDPGTAAFIVDNGDAIHCEIPLKLRQFLGLSATTPLKAQNDGSLVAGAINLGSPTEVSGAFTTGNILTWGLNAIAQTAIIALNHGGTGATTAGGARINLDVYSKAEVDALIDTVQTELDNFIIADYGTHFHTVSVPSTPFFGNTSGVSH